MTADATASDTGLLAAGVDEAALVTALRAGDEAAFRDLVTRYHPALVRLARTRVASRAVAEEVAQDTWLAVIRSISGFEGRSSLRTWIFRILMNQAARRGAREKLSIPMSELGSAGQDDAAVAVVHPDRFVRENRRWAGHWSDPPTPWTDLPAERLIGMETIRFVANAIGELPGRQREVVTLRDIEGWTAEEVCDLLGLSPGNQRVLVHRGRSLVRARLESHLEGKG